MQTVYIAGPMTGIPNHNFPAFDRCKKLLLDLDYCVFSPADISRNELGLGGRDMLQIDDPRAKSMTYPLAMALDLPYVCRADIVCFLPGWTKSKGTAIERLVAERLDKVFLYVDLKTGVFHVRPLADDAPQHDEAPVESICAEADRLVSGARQKDYGHPLDNWTLTADLADPIVKEGLRKHGKLRAEEMLLVMQAVKIARELNASKRDNRVDGAGYWKCVDMVIAERASREEF